MATVQRTSKRPYKIQRFKSRIGMLHVRALIRNRAVSFRNRLIINKTELILIGTRLQLGKINDVCNISVGEYAIYPISYVRMVRSLIISCQCRCM